MVISMQRISAIQWRSLQFLLLMTWASATATELKAPSLGVKERTRRVLSLEASEPYSFSSEDFKDYFYEQTLDHFNYRPESYATFKQRYVINYKFWGGANSSAPIFVYLGEESPLDNDIDTVGFLTDHAPKFNALVVFIEHRYYGQSVPFGSMEEAFQNASTLGYFSSSQALADYAEVILYIKKSLSAESCPVVVIGGSYGGMLAAWFRLKYPHIALGALASSAPILYFEDITPQNGYYSIVTKDFRETSENCYNTIRQSWSKIDKTASQPNGLSVLTKKFKTCFPLNSSSELKDYLETIYNSAAQYDRPPRFPVSAICSAIDNTSKGADLLSKVFAGLVAYKGNQSCYDTKEFKYSTETERGWNWQRCSEMVMPIGRGSNDTMFQAAPFNLTNFKQRCKRLYGINPRSNWITTQFGGHDIELVLKRFGGNIIFSNGLRDPYSSGSVLKNISDSLVAIYTTQGAHCMDILPESPDDPKWLVMQRNQEIKIIGQWIKQYYMDRLANH